VDGLAFLGRNRAGAFVSLSPACNIAVVIRSQTKSGETRMTEALSKLNFRDVGGIPTDTGGVVRPGILYRSEGPASFADVHRSELRALGIKLICDLRSDSERNKDPNDWAETARLLNFDITADLRVSTNAGWATLKDDPTVEAGKRALVTNYAEMPGQMLPNLNTLVDAIVAGGTPVLVHCTAGKDRTGVMVAILLTALGVPHDLILADYERSEIFARNMRARGGVHEQFEEHFGFRPTERLIDAMIGVDIEYLEAALATVVEKWGSIERYFAAAGVDEGQLDRFRETLVAA
jgi:protein-tyrosine phosphatase